MTTIFKYFSSENIVAWLARLWSLHAYPEIFWPQLVDLIKKINEDWTTFITITQ